MLDINIHLHTNVVFLFYGFIGTTVVYPNIVVKIDILEIPQCLAIYVRKNNEKNCFLKIVILDSVIK